MCVYMLAAEGNKNRMKVQGICRKNKEGCKHQKARIQKLPAEKTCSPVKRSKHKPKRKKAQPEGPGFCKGCRSPLFNKRKRNDRCMRLFFVHCFSYKAVAVRSSFAEKNKILRRLDILNIHFSIGGSIYNNCRSTYIYKDTCVVLYSHI